MNKYIENMGIAVGMTGITEAIGAEGLGGIAGVLDDVAVAGAQANQHLGKMASSLDTNTLSAQASAKSYKSLLSTLYEVSRSTPQIAGSMTALEKRATYLSETTLASKKSIVEFTASVSNMASVITTSGRTLNQLTRIATQEFGENWRRASETFIQSADRIKGLQRDLFSSVNIRRYGTDLMDVYTKMGTEAGDTFKRLYEQQHGFTVKTVDDFMRMRDAHMQAMKAMENAQLSLGKAWLPFQLAGSRAIAGITQNVVEPIAGGVGNLMNAGAPDNVHNGPIGDLLTYGAAGWGAYKVGSKFGGTVVRNLPFGERAYRYGGNLSEYYNYGRMNPQDVGLNSFVARAGQQTTYTGITTGAAGAGAVSMGGLAGAVVPAATIMAIIAAVAMYFGNRAYTKSWGRDSSEMSQAELNYRATNESMVDTQLGLNSRTHTAKISSLSDIRKHPISYIWGVGSNAGDMGAYISSIYQAYRMGREQDVRGMALAQEQADAQAAKGAADATEYSDRVSSGSMESAQYARVLAGQATAANKRAAQLFNQAETAKSGEDTEAYEWLYRQALSEQQKGTDYDTAKSAVLSKGKAWVQSNLMRGGVYVNTGAVKNYLAGVQMQSQWLEKSQAYMGEASSYIQSMQAGGASAGAIHGYAAKELLAQNKAQRDILQYQLNQISPNAAGSDEAIRLRTQLASLDAQRKQLEIEHKYAIFVPSERKADEQFLTFALNKVKAIGGSWREQQPILEALSKQYRIQSDILSSKGLTYLRDNPITSANIEVVMQKATQVMDGYIKRIQSGLEARALHTEDRIGIAQDILGARGQFASTTGMPSEMQRGIAVAEAQASGAQYANMLRQYTVLARYAKYGVSPTGETRQFIQETIAAGRRAGRDVSGLEKMLKGTAIGDTFMREQYNALNSQSMDYASKRMATMTPTMTGAAGVYEQTLGYREQMASILPTSLGVQYGIMGEKYRWSSKKASDAMNVYRRLLALGFSPNSEPAKQALGMAQQYSAEAAQGRMAMYGGISGQFESMMNQYNTQEGDIDATGPRYANIAGMNIPRGLRSSFKYGGFGSGKRRFQWQFGKTYAEGMNPFLNDFSYIPGNAPSKAYLMPGEDTRTPDQQAADASITMFNTSTNKFDDAVTKFQAAVLHMFPTKVSGAIPGP